MVETICGGHLDCEPVGRRVQEIAAANRKVGELIRQLRDNGAIVQQEQAVFTFREDNNMGGAGNESL